MLKLIGVKLTSSNDELHTSLLNLTTLTLATKHSIVTCYLGFLPQHGPLKLLSNDYVPELKGPNHVLIMKEQNGDQDPPTYTHHL